MASLARGIKKLLQVFFLLALPFCAYAGWLHWEIHKVQSFCGDVRPGTSVADLPAIADRHGVNLGRGEGVYDESAKNWFLPVPVMPTFGDVACLIRHDKKMVQSAAMDGL
jgi:hypothetical protein